MDALVLRTATRYLLPLMLLFSVFVLLRGHNAPGGGFVGGLVAASAYALYAIAYNVQRARQIMPVSPRRLMGIGLLLAASSGVIGLAAGKPLRTAVWDTGELPGLRKLGTALLFDIGVYLTVTVVKLTIIFALAEEE